MPLFEYSALSLSGETKSGSLQASNRSDAFRKLEAQALTPVKVSEPSGSGKVSDSSKPAGGGHIGPIRLKRTQLIHFTEELADLLDGGLQVDQALRVMHERQESIVLRKVAESLREDIREGSTLSKALRKASPSFDDLYCNLVAAGEVSGSLAPILRRLGANLTVLAELQSKVTQAMIYPAFLIGACIVLMIVFMTFMVPQITDLLAKNGQKLPLPTQLLISFNSFVAAWWWVILLIIVIGGLLFKGYINTPKGRMWWDEAKLKMPLFGGILSTRFYAQFAHSLGNLVANGVPLLNSIRLVSRISANVFIQSLLAKVTTMVAEGTPLSTALKKVGHFPLLLADMISIGEQTGRLGGSLEKSAIRYDKELDKQIRRMTALISPVIIIFMAILVGVVAYSIVTAIFQSVSGIRGRV